MINNIKKISFKTHPFVMVGFLLCIIIFSISVYLIPRLGKTTEGNPEVVSVSFRDTYITAQDIGDPFIITIVYDRPMNTNIEQVLTPSTELGETTVSCNLGDPSCKYLFDWQENIWVNNTTWRSTWLITPRSRLRARE